MCACAGSCVCVINRVFFERGMKVVVYEWVCMCMCGFILYNVVYTVFIHLMNFLSQRFTWYSMNFLLCRPRFLRVTNISCLSKIHSCKISGENILTNTLANTDGSAYHYNYNSNLKYPKEKIYMYQKLIIALLQNQPMQNIQP